MNEDYPKSPKSAAPDFHISLLTSETVDSLKGFEVFKNSQQPRAEAPVLGASRLVFFFWCRCCHQIALPATFIMVNTILEIALFAALALIPYTVFLLFSRAWKAAALCLLTLAVLYVGGVKSEEHMREDARRETSRISDEYNRSHPPFIDQP